LFRRNFTEGLNEARSIAFQLAATENSTASEALSKDSFGHLGFTGTSLWIDPNSERIYILLTNRHTPAHCPSLISTPFAAAFTNSLHRNSGFRIQDSPFNIAAG
jgi:CubicO group peptidase (beta-lactamase class C family)